MKKVFVNKGQNFSVSEERVCILLSKQSQVTKVVAVKDDSVLRINEFFENYEDANLVTDDRCISLKALERMDKQKQLNVVVETADNAAILFENLKTDCILWLYSNTENTKRFLVFDSEEILTKELLLRSEKHLEVIMPSMIGDPTLTICKKYLDLFGWKCWVDKDGSIIISEDDSKDPLKFLEAVDFISFFIKELDARISSNFENEDIRQYVVEYNQLASRVNELLGEEKYPAENYFAEKIGADAWTICKKYFSCFGWKYLYKSLKDSFISVYTGNDELKTYTTQKEFIDDMIKEVEYKLEESDYGLGLQEIYAKELLVLDNAFRDLEFNEIFGSDIWGKVARALDEKNCTCFLDDDGSIIIIDLTAGSRSRVTFSNFLGLIRHDVNKEDYMKFDLLYTHYKGLEFFSENNPNVSGEVLSVLDKVVRNLDSYIKVTEAQQFVRVDCLGQIVPGGYDSEQLLEWLFECIKETLEYCSTDEELVAEYSQYIDILKKHFESVAAHMPKDLFGDDIEEMIPDEFFVVNNSIKTKEEPLICELRGKHEGNLGGLRRVIFNELLRSKEIGMILDKYMPANIDIVIDEFNQLYKISKVIEDIGSMDNGYEKVSLLDVICLVKSAMQEARVVFLYSNDKFEVQNIDKDLQLIEDYLKY